MTVEELIEELKHMPSTARIVFRYYCDDDFDDYEAINVNYDKGEVFINIRTDEDDEADD